MNIHIEFLTSDKHLTVFKIFTNDNPCGTLCMDTNDAGSFHQILAHGCAKGIDTFTSSGTVHHAPEKSENSDESH